MDQSLKESMQFWSPHFKKQLENFTGNEEMMIKNLLAVPTAWKAPPSDSHGI